MTTPAQLAKKLADLAKAATLESIYPDSLGYIPSANLTDLHTPERRIAEFVPKESAALIVALVNSLPQIIEALERVDEWMPIETAPRDGTPLLLYRPWDDKTMDAGYPGPIWHSAGWGKSAFPGDTFRGEATYGKPTHWRPLPAPPRAALSGDAQ